MTDSGVVLDSLPVYSPEEPIAMFKYVLSLVGNREAGSKLTYIYTGGIWVHAHGTGGLETWTDERQPHSGQVKMTAWRWQVEKEILTSTYIRS